VTAPRLDARPGRPEHQLLLAAAYCGRGPRPSIDEPLSAELNWTTVIELALQHRLTPALLAALERADRSLVPPEILDALRTHCGHLQRACDAMVDELFAILDLLARDSVLAVPFKGPMLAELLYGGRGQRAPGDLDILVAADDVRRVCAVLESRGYVDAEGPPLTAAQQRMYRWLQCEYYFARERDGLIVEPHWAFSQRRLAIDVDYAGMLGRARPTQLAGRTVPMLVPEDLLLALCIHGAKHHWERLAWIRDVSALLTAMPGLDVEACLARARSCGCERVLLVGMGVARRYAGAALPATIERMIAADRQALNLEREVGRWLFDAGRRSPVNDRVDRFRFLIRERWRDRLRYVTRTWLFPGRDHLEMVALPEPLLWAYFPVKWAHDYVALPLWRVVRPIVRRAGTAILAGTCHLTG
jgi:hypothetical protein